MNDATVGLYELGRGLTLDLADRSLSAGGEPVPLAPKAFEVLAVLAHAEGRLVSHEELRQRVWPDWKPETFNAGQLHFQFTKIREALKPHVDGPCIQAVPRQGFRLTLPVRRVGLVSDPAAPTEPPPAVPSAIPRRRPARVYVMAAGLIALAAATASLVVGRADERLRVVAYTPLTRDRVAGIGPLFADRTSVYFRAPGKLDQLFAISPQGGEPRLVLPASAGFSAWDVDADGHEFIGGRPEEGANDYDAWRLPLTSGKPVRLGALRCNGAAWSSDGTHVACGSTSGLVVATADGADVRTIARIAAFPENMIFAPRWSPDDSKIRFSISKAGNADVPTATLWEVATDGTGLRQVVPEWGGRIDTCCGTWSPGGDYFVFRAITDRRSNLWAIREPRGLLGKASPPFPLTAGPLNFEWPAFGPDGSTLFAIGWQARGELMRFDLARSEFFQYLPGISGSWVTFSPDRRSVAYVGYPDRQVWRAGADGTGQRQLTTGPFENSTTAWSPDGRWIAFRSRRAGQRLRIFLMPPDGGEPQPIMREDREQGTPAWSPDATRIAFGDVPRLYGIPDGGERIHVYELAARTIEDLPGSDGLWTARWSPDPRYLAATRITDRRLHIYDFDRRTWRQLPVDHVEQLTWSRDAAWIYFHTEGGEVKLRRVRVADAYVEDLADLVPREPLDYSWSGLTPDGEPILLRNLGTQDVFTLKLDRR